MNEIKVAKTNAVTTINGYGAITMPADTGRETKKIFVALEAGNKANLQLCKSIARIKTTESYKEVFDADGLNITPTFGDFAEKVLEMSKSGASGYASVGEVFTDYLDDSGYKYGHFVLMLKMRKILDENGEPLRGKDIVEMLEEHGATPEMSTRKLDELIKNLLCAEESKESESEEESESEGESTAEDESESVSLTTAFDIIRRALESNGLYETWGGKLSEIENLF